VSGLPGGVKCALLAALLALALYAPSLRGPFISDDWLYLERNEAVQLPALDALRLVLTEPYFGVGNWSPAHQLLLLGEWKFFGDDPLPYRIVNVLLHVGVAAALAVAARRAGLAPGAALAAAGLFLVHPVAVEAVAWINQSKTLLAAGFSLLATERWLAHLQSPAPGRRAAVWILGALALLAKPAALPLVGILAVAIATHGRWRAGPLLDLAPLAVLTAFVLSLNLAAQRAHGGVAPWFGGSPEATARVVPWLLWRYVRLVVWPVDLVHGVHPAPVASWIAALPALAALAVAAALAAAACRARPCRALGVAWFALMLLPVLQVVPMINLFADRYLYMALPGALAVIADAGSGFARRGGRSRRLGAAIALAGALAALSALTTLRARMWADPEALYAEATRAYPLGRTGWTGLGAERHRRGDLDGAAAAYLESLRVAPEDGHVRHLLARIRLRQHRPDLALYDLEESLRLAPHHVDAEWMRRTVRRLRSRGIEPAEDPPR
jgi:protein O-mannosyl-transferase